MIPSGLTSTSSGSSGCRSTAAASAENGCADSPWYDRVQSTYPGPSCGERDEASAEGVSRSEAGASLRPVLEMSWIGGGVGLVGVEVVADDLRVAVVVPGILEGEGAGGEGFGAVVPLWRGV